MKKIIFLLMLFSIVFLTTLTYLNSFQLIFKPSKFNFRSQSLSAKWSNAQQSNQTISPDFLAKYEFLLDCQTNYNSFLPNQSSSERFMDPAAYAQSAPQSTHNLRITRAILVYFPIELSSQFILEFKWMYRSWIEMQKSEPTKWRTDLVIFADTSHELFKDNTFFLNVLNCSTSNRRKSREDEPLCILMDYKPLKQREVNQVVNTVSYEYFLEDFDIFNQDDAYLSPFYAFLKQNLANYNYLDSILMAFDGYKYFKSAGYDFLIRSDMDVFLTPLFGSWLPKYCNDFYVGRGGFSSTFNINRLRRVAKELKLEYAEQINLGSTWYSTPEQFRLVSYLTLFSMVYISIEEFTPPERENKLGVMLWPWWHYGVLLLYGQSLALNHLIATNQMNVVKLEDMLDYPSYFDGNINKMIHIHVFHGDDLFSKFEFKANKYDQMNPDSYDQTNPKYYALKMALDAKRTADIDLRRLFELQIKNKT